MRGPRFWGSPVPQWLEELPFVAAFLILYAGATIRGQAVYWLARWATERTIGSGEVSPWRMKVRDWLAGDRVARGRDALQRWGLPVIPLSYLTVGFQTLVHAAAGVLRVRWLPFTLVQIPGALAWGFIYSTVGFAAWEAAIGAAAASPAGIAVIGLAVVLVGTLVFRRLGGDRSA